jgi:hypothetical protein
VSVLQAWLIIGVPALVLGLALFLGRSRTLAWTGYVVLAAGFGGVATVHRPSAAVFGGLLALLYGAGRGGAAEVADHDLDQVGVPSGTEDPGHGHVGAAGPAGTADAE